MTSVRVIRTVQFAVLAALTAALAGCGAASVPSTGPDPSLTVPASQLPAVKRPNILVIETDDMRYDELRWMPNVRRFIAGTGLTFENSFAPYPLCCPSRSSFLTGKYAHNHHVLSHVLPFGFHSFDDSVTLATRLQAGGYQTALVGKYLNGYGQQAIHGTTKPSLYYVPPGWTSWQAGSDHLWRPGQQLNGKPIGGNTYAYFDLTQNIDGRIRNFDGQYNTDVLARETRGLITRFSAAEKPWFIWFTPIAPHEGSPLEADDPPPSLRSDGKFTVWQTPARPDWVKGRFDSRITHGLGTPPYGSAESDVSDKPLWIRQLPDLTAAEKLGERAVTRQRAESLYALDRQVGLTLETLRASGQYDNTILAFTSDNGYYLGEHRKREGKIQLHEPSLRVPFLISGPGVPHGLRYDPIATVDLAPTFAAYAGIGPMSRADGLNMIPVITGGDRGWFRPIVTEGRMGEYPRNVRKYGFNSQLNARGLRLGRWKLTDYSTGEQELYDLQSDPLELVNLAADPHYAKIFADLQALWYQYKDCAGAACMRPVPKAWQTSVAQETAITVQEFRRTNLYFGN